MSPEYRPIPGFPGLRASSDGSIESDAKGRWSRVGFLRKGYVYVHHGGGQHAAHRLIALAFHGEPTGPLVRHLNGDPSDNRPDNLAWGTQLENMADAKRLGELRYGLEHHNWRSACKWGHPLSGPNLQITGGRRRCRACQRVAVRKYRSKQVLD
jgi:hypothetical protein